MTPEAAESEVLAHVVEWHAWLARGGAEPSPAFFTAVEARLPLMLCGFLVHSVLALVHRAFTLLHLHFLAGRIAALRIATDGLSFEPRQCGLNNAYNNLGLAYLKRGKVAGAITCLEQSWRVYPCPHNTSFGLRMKLCKALASYPEAVVSVNNYKRINGVFVAQPGAPADGPASASLRQARG